VDKLHGQEEIVMKSMGEYLKGTNGVAGACITGDGNVILILDVSGLIETSERLFLRQ
jgi:two-component system chemotaxis sensor kinase CheA